MFIKDLTEQEKQDIFDALNMVEVGFIKHTEMFIKGKAVTVFKWGNKIILSIENEIPQTFENMKGDNNND